MRASICIVLALAACQSMPSAKPAYKVTEYTTQLVYPMIDADLLSCAPEPTVPDGIMTDIAALAWTEAVRQAGQDCRSKVDALRDTVAKWPKPP